jgi:UDP-N-acetylglucosamine--N-acetylmuramyl-(pentapeptide) pyrophosphoryl-undecaprenol N-acetylglucosamine transferase
MSPAVSNPVALAAGGTGGHMFPAEALARELLGRGLSVALITDRRGTGFGGLAAAVPVHRVSGAGVAGRSVLQRIGAVLWLAVGYLQARAVLSRLAPRVIVGFGGYASVPAVLAAAHRGAAVVLHEQNAVLGRANRLLASRATVIATSFPHVAAVPPAAAGRVRETGNPVRAAVAKVAATPYRPPAPGGPVRLLITGGSQGAAVFSRLVPEALALAPEALRRRLEVVQQARPEDLDRVRQRYQELGIKATLSSFFEDLPERLARAHLVVCRAGASTVAELTRAGRPAILVPFPSAIDDHQTRNAQALEANGAAWLLAERGLEPRTLADRLAELAAAPDRLAAAAAAARSIAHDGAAAALAEVVVGLLPGNGEAPNGESTGRGRAPDPGAGRERAA